ncbi:hypothetical protein BY996DRAFT_8415918 [Phakopsora pachyrhizi]|nr:hypothetical protein BY996DRAFT_8415918 [Phakopsora pachyrhizi]
MLKAVRRTPHIITSKVGMAKSSSDLEVEDLKRRFTAIESESAKLLKDAKAYRDAVSKMLVASHQFGQAYITLLSPMSNEEDLSTRYPESAKTIEQMASYQELITDLRDTIQPELDLIESRIIAPVKEYLEVLKSARKMIVKRDHKLIDFDRHNNAYMKLAEKKEKTLKDEQNIFKIEQDCQAASADYEHYNEILRTQIPRFLQLTNSFISPLFHSFFYMQLNVVYTTYEKLQQFSQGRFDFDQADIESTFLSRINAASEKVESLTITKRAPSTAKVISEVRQATGEAPPLSAKPSTSSFSSTSRPPPPSLSAKPSWTGKPGPASYKTNGFSAPGLAPKPTLSGGFKKTQEDQQQSSAAATFAPPPPYSMGSNSGSVASAIAQRQSSSTGAGNGPIPPPPPLRSKPSQTQATYVTALYDFQAQAEGDLSFSAGDRIELVKRTESEEDWWTGRLNGVEGVFPGNYVQH